MTKSKNKPAPKNVRDNFYAGFFKHSDYPGKNDGGPIKGEPFLPKPAPPPKA